MNQFYCQSCLEENRHAHGVVRIDRGLAEIQRKHGELKSQVDALLARTHFKVGNLLGLLKFLDDVYVPQYVLGFKLMGQDANDLLKLPSKIFRLAIKLDGEQTVKQLESTFQTVTEQGILQ